MHIMITGINLRRNIPVTNWKDLWWQTDAEEIREDLLFAAL